MKTIIAFISLVILVTGIVNSSATAQTAEEILERIDSTQNAYRDMEATEQMKLIDNNGSEKQRIVTIQQKGKELRLVRFLKPADVRGVGFLRIASDRLYLYLPAFRKVRRIASSVKNEDFMGTDFTYEDLSQTRYARDYTPGSLTKHDQQWVLGVKARDGADVSYGKLILHADIDTYVVRLVEYFDDAGNKVKELTTGNVAKISGYWTPQKMTMKTLKDDHQTVLELSGITFDRGLSDFDFSERNLKRPLR